VLENGPHGVDGSNALISGGPEARAKKYTSGYSGLTEIILKNEFGKGVTGSNLDSEVKEFY